LTSFRSVFNPLADQMRTKGATPWNDARLRVTDLAAGWCIVT